MKKELREKVWNKYNKHCAYCGKILEYKQMQVDHIIPKLHTWTKEYLAKVNRNRADTTFTPYQEPIVRGTDNFENLLPTCRRCNLLKTDGNIETLRWQIQNKIFCLNEYTNNYKLVKDYGLVEETGNKVVFYFEKHNSATGKNGA